MEMMKTCCSEVNLNVEILPNRNSWMNFFSYFIYNFEEKKDKTEKNKRNYSTLLYIMKSLELFIFVLKLKK